MWVMTAWRMSAMHPLFLLCWSCIHEYFVWYICSGHSRCKSTPYWSVRVSRRSRRWLNLYLVVVLTPSKRKLLLQLVVSHFRVFINSHAQCTGKAKRCRWPLFCGRPSLLAWRTVPSRRGLLFPLHMAFEITGWITLLLVAHRAGPFACTDEENHGGGIIWSRLLHLLSDYVLYCPLNWMLLCEICACSNEKLSTRQETFITNQ